MRLPPLTPAAEVRAGRIDRRGRLAANRTRAEDGARAVLRGAGVVVPKKPGSWTKKGLAWLRRP